MEKIMAERFTIYAGEPVAGILAGYESNRSGRINQVAADYRSIIREETPTFSPAEWQAIADVLNGTFVADEASLRLVWASIADSGEDGIGEKWGIDIDALAQRVRRLSLAQLIALREVVARFWASIDGSTDNVALLRQCGARMSGESPDGGLVAELRRLDVTADEAEAMARAVAEMRRR